MYVFINTIISYVRSLLIYFQTKSVLENPLHKKVLTGTRMRFRFAVAVS